ncbi:hypothetical protein ARMSODRAFT_981280 [Armillaria solidipes]|uniref:Uncharacterized protein n=1 Tax=Armillaria solidipes TaxID=1076256 RepID=A0A2H3B6Q8_9AGAR|nr:hypothetical protein ARMSODRAFT_981280 [Armillaria solidipes]
MDVPPPDLSQDEKSLIFEVLDTSLNDLILNALLHGLYTGIVAVTLWAILNWACDGGAFIDYGYNYYTVYTALTVDGPWGVAWDLVNGITGGISTLLVDIWRCWELWGRQWQIVSLPVISAVVGTTMKTLQNISIFTHDISKTGGFTPSIDWEQIYAMLTLMTNLMCTLLIVYRIVRFAHTLFFFRSIIFALIESSAVYTLALIVYLVLEGRSTRTSEYAGSFADYNRAIAPTLLVLRVATGSTSSFDDKESNQSRIISDICFRPMDENSDDSSVKSFSGSHRISTTESV